MEHCRFLELQLLVFCGLLMVLQIHASSRDRFQRIATMNECVREAVPDQVYRKCCVQDRNCSVVRQRDQGYECIARVILANLSSSEEDWRTEYASSGEEKRNGFSSLLLQAGDYCQTLRRQDQQRICLRGEMMKMCENDSSRYYRPPRMEFSRNPYDNPRSSGLWTFRPTRWMETTRDPFNRFGQRGQRTDYYGGRTPRDIYDLGVSNSGSYGDQGAYGYQNSGRRDDHTSFGNPSAGRVESGSYDSWGSWNGGETPMGQIEGYDSSDYEPRT